MLEAHRALAPRDRELVPRPGKAPQDIGLGPPEPDVLAPGEDGVVETVKAEVRVSEDAVDFGGRPVGALLGLPEVEARVVVVLRAHVTKRELGEDEAALLVEGVRLGQELV